MPWTALCLYRWVIQLSFRYAGLAIIFNLDLIEAFVRFIIVSNAYFKFWRFRYPDLAPKLPLSYLVSYE